MKFLVTGGAGFIGSHLVERLLADDHDVVVIDNFSTGKRENVEPFGRRITLVEGSITTPAVCEEGVAGVDHVLHQAALGSVPRSVADPVATHQANATGTLNLLVAARAAGVKRFVYASSSSAYGDTPELPKHERMFPRPRSPYAVAKLAGEQYCQAFFLTYGFETVALRYFNVFGARQDPTSQYAAVIPKFITAAFNNEQPTIFGDGKQTRDFTFISNVVAANLLACKAAASACGGVYNVGAGAQTSLNELWRQIAELTGAAVTPKYAPTRPGDVRDSLASLDLVGSHLGYRASVSVNEGLRRTVEAFSGVEIKR